MRFKQFSTIFLSIYLNSLARSSEVPHNITVPLIDSIESNIHKLEVRANSPIFVPRHEYWIRRISNLVNSFVSYLSTSNEPCWTPNGNRGVCTTRKHCQTTGGIPNEACKNGFSVCCSYMFACGRASGLSGTYFVNSDFPEPSIFEQAICEHVIVKVHGICQIRLDFDVFEIGNPRAGDGHCQGGSLKIYGAENEIPALCGNLNGHHVYLWTAVHAEAIRLAIEFDLSLWGRWKIRITKLECSSNALAPGGCLQYYTAESGRITSFNYMESNLAELDYAVCVRRQGGYCAIQWSKCSLWNIEAGWKRRKRSLQMQDNFKIKANLNANASTYWYDGLLEENASSKAINTPKNIDWNPFNSNRYRHAQLPDVSRIDNETHQTISFQSTEISRKLKFSQPKPPALYQSVKLPTPFLPKTKPLGIGHLPKLQKIGLTKFTPKLPTHGKIPLKSSAFNKPSIASKPIGKVPLKIFEDWAKPKVNPKPVIKVLPKTKPRPWIKNIGIKNGLGEKFKPKHPGLLPSKNKFGNCHLKVIPIPLPVPIPIPIGPVIIPFPFGGGGGSSGGWKESHKKIISATEPFLLRVVTKKGETDEKLEKSHLSSFCMEWEQISCDDWHSPEYS